jgi:hypothetical protein
MRWARLAGAVLLATAFLLPQYTCAVYRGPQGNVLPPPAEADRSHYREIQQSHYAWEGIRWNDPASWLVVAVFGWPLPLLIYRYRVRGPLWWWLPLTLELGLVAGSAYLIWFLSDWGERAVGAYLGIAGNGVYTLALLNEVWRRCFSSPGE